MDDFNQELVTKLVSRKFESLKVDYKLTLDLSNEKHKQELIKDVSAQVNTMEVDESLVALGATGLTGCIIIGTNEQGNLQDTSGLKLDDAKFQQIVNENITPRIRFLFKSLDILDTKNGSTVRIGLILLPRSSKPPHRLYKDYKGLRQGQCFVREGTSTREAKDEDLEKMYAHRLGVEQSIVSLQSIKFHLDAIRQDERFARWLDPLFIRSDSTFLPVYASPFAADAESVAAKEKLINLLRKHERLIVLGESGIGKTTALERLTLEYSEWKSGADISIVPIFVPLLGYTGSLMEAVRVSVKQYGQITPRNESELRSLLEGMRCAVLLDGLNEVPGRFRDIICADVMKLISEFPKTKLIITSAV